MADQAGAAPGYRLFAQAILYERGKDRLEAYAGNFTFGQNTEFEDTDMAHILKQHIHRLPESQQGVIRLGFLESKSQREMARATNAPLGTIKTRMELALKKLRIGLRAQHGMSSLRTAS